MIKIVTYQLGSISKRASIANELRLVSIMKKFDYIRSIMTSISFDLEI